MRNLARTPFSTFPFWKDTSNVKSQPCGRLEISISTLTLDTSPAYGALYGTSFNALQAGRSYTLVLNLKSVFFLSVFLATLGADYQGEKGEGYVSASDIQIGFNSLLMCITSDNVAKTNEEVLKEVGAWGEPEAPAEPEA